MLPAVAARLGGTVAAGLQGRLPADRRSVKRQLLCPHSYHSQRILLSRLITDRDGGSLHRYPLVHNASLGRAVLTAASILRCSDSLPGLTWPIQVRGELIILSLHKALSTASKFYSHFYALWDNVPGLRKILISKCGREFQSPGTTAGRPSGSPSSLFSG